MSDIIAYLQNSNNNSYLQLLRESLQKANVKVNDLPSQITSKWLEENQGTGRILHYHWPSFYYTTASRSQTDELLGIWIDNLKLARKLAYGIVWTAHNLYPHENNYHDIHHRGRLAIIEHSTGIIAHCKFAAKELRRRFGGGTDIAVIPHGNYLNAYGRPAQRKEARQILGVSESSFLYLCFGMIRPYKGIDYLIKVFRSSAPVGTELLIAGMPTSSDLLRRLESITSGDRRIYLHAKFIEDEMIPMYFGAADVIVQPYSTVLTSGSVVLAHSMGKPVVVPAIGCMPEMVREGTGITYNPQRGGLALALKSALNLDLDKARDKALSLAQASNWECIGVATRDVYRKAATKATSTASVYSAIQSKLVYQSRKLQAKPPALDKSAVALRIERFFEIRLSNKLMEQADYVNLLNTSYKFIFSDLNEIYWVVDLRGANREVSREQQEVDCLISVTSFDFISILENKLDLEFAYLRGDITVDGNLKSAIRLRPLLAE